MEPQDRSRFAILELEPLPAGAAKLNLEGAGLPEIGAVLMRRMFDGWWRWADTFGAYHDVLTAIGHSPRSADTFGTLLAAADLALYDAMPEGELLEEWAQACAPDQLAEISETREDHDDCLGHLTTTTVQARGGDLRETLGTWIGRAVSHLADMSEPARSKLAEFGLGVVNSRRTPSGGVGAVEHMAGQPCYLAVAHNHRALAEIFGASKWQGGGWHQTLARAPGAKRGAKFKFARSSLTAVLVPIELVIDASDVPGFVACSLDGAA
jgi:hypothetical protein